jgi:protoheme IX farnesyltransferase
MVSTSAALKSLRKRAGQSETNEDKNRHDSDGNQDRKEDCRVILGPAGGRQAGGIAVAADGATPGHHDPAAHTAVVLVPHTRKSIPGADGPSFAAAGVRMAARPAKLVAGARSTVRVYLELTKPRIVLLLLITTVPSMILAAGAFPSLGLVAATLLGGAAAAGGANAVNQFLDRDIDGIMRRTRHRPLPARRIEPWRALAFGLSLIVSGSVWLAVNTNLAAASLAAGAAGFYVLVYTLWLKRRSPNNIVIGGAAGAAPALVGWAAVTGHLSLAAAVLFGIVLLWTPPHFWALALRFERDYAAAGVPMLPVVAGRDATAKQIVLYSILLVALSLSLVPVGGLGPVYLVSALGLGAMFVARAVQVRLRPATNSAIRLFRFSIVYLTLLFLSVAADALWRARG